VRAGAGAYGEQQPTEAKSCEQILALYFMAVSFDLALLPDVAFFCFGLLLLAGVANAFFDSQNVWDDVWFYRGATK
jgi:hypothetical protein